MIDSSNVTNQNTKKKKKITSHYAHDNDYIKNVLVKTVNLAVF